MPFEIIRDDITHVRADAIVNTANPDPVIGVGTDSAIHRAAGPKLLAARRRIGPIAVGTSVKTRAYDLSAKYVLHTVSPEWIDGTHGEEALLRSAYDAALTLADRLHCRSVAFPLLSAGNYGFPQEKALSIAINAFTDFLLTHELQIYLVVFGTDAYSLARGLFGDLRAYIDDHYVDAAKKAEYTEDRRRLRTNRNAMPFAADEAMLSGEESDAAAPKPAGVSNRPQYFTPYHPKENERAPKPQLQPTPPSFTHPTAAQKAVFAPAKRPAVQKAEVKPSDLDTILKGRESTFSEHLLDLLKECGEKDSEVYHRAEISRQLFNKIINKKDYQPTKSTAIQLAMGLRLDLLQTQKLLEKAGYALTRSSKTDLVVQYFIERGVYSIVAVNMALYDCGLPLLKTGSVS